MREHVKTDDLFQFVRTILTVDFFLVGHGVPINVSTAFEDHLQILILDINLGRFVDFRDSTPFCVNFGDIALHDG